MENQTRVYVKGSCPGGRTGPGGWAALIFKTPKGRRSIETSGGERMTSNNRMEIQALIAALSLLPNKDEHIVVHTDSTYVMNGCTKWKPQKNDQELWSVLYSKLQGREKSLTFNFFPRKGHSGDENSERVVRIAREKAMNYH